MSRFQPGLSFPIKQTEAPKTAQGCWENSVGPLPIFSETDENYLGWRRLWISKTHVWLADNFCELDRGLVEMKP